jgi:hypothetical protein
VPAVRLTDVSIRAFKAPPAGQRTYWDRGLGVRVSQGRRTVLKKSSFFHTVAVTYRTAKFVVKARGEDIDILVDTVSIAGVRHSPIIRTST